ncbi:MAG: sulfurtransferase TusA family protein [Paracoccaceae bacterium]
MQWDIELDCRGLLCPLPVLKAQKRLGGMAGGQVLAVLATDAMAAVDMPHFCGEAGHQFLGSEAVDDATRYLIRRG